MVGVLFVGSDQEEGEERREEGGGRREEGGGRMEENRGAHV